ncbi:MAG: protein kinase, partial [Pyrinomonadaceae bacterium]
VKVLDFGLAKIIGANAPDHTELTELGTAYGTPTYAAPEQSKGERVDHRADIFSTGVLLYEMLTGSWPFRGKTAVDVRHAVLHDKPAPLDEKRGQEIPVALEAAIFKALAKEPKRRFQHMADFRDDLIEILTEMPEGETSETARFVGSFSTVSPRHLRGFGSRRSLIAAGVLSALILALVGFFGYRYGVSDSGTSAIESIAVMPFVNDGGADTEYLLDGFTDTLINSLRIIPNLQVKARSSLTRLKSLELSPREIGSELDVEAILNGRVVQRGDGLELTLELVDARTENIVWRNKYDRKMDDLATLQSDIARDVSDKLRQTLTGVEYIAPEPLQTGYNP